LAAFPCWELVRIIPVRVERDWKARWKEVGGQLYEGRMIAPKGDLIWGELGSAFDDSLDVDYPPFAFNSGMGWREIGPAEARRLGVVSADGVPWDEFIQDVERPRVLQGELPLPTPRLNMKDIDLDLAKEFLDQTKAYDNDGEFSFDSILERELKKADEAYQK